MGVGGRSPKNASASSERSLAGAGPGSSPTVIRMGSTRAGAAGRHTIELH